MKFLCVGDIHLGRRPARLSAAVLELLGGALPGPAAAWKRSVDLALAEQVDAVLLAGDVVEQEDDFYEAFGDLSQGVQRLAAAGIPVLGVAGNHDVKVLPRLADSVPGFHLLGRDGEWESFRLEGRRGEADILGWSFPQRRVRDNPLARELPPRDNRLTLGLLHCDRDQAGSHYAPVAARELAQAPVDAWLLGHIHKPDALAGPRPIGYLGSLSALDPGEGGDHGPWLLHSAEAGALRIEQVALSPLRWEEVTVPVDGLSEAADIHQRITAALAALQDRLAQMPHPPVAVGCRLILRGRSDLGTDIERCLLADDPRQSPQAREGLVCFVHAWRLEILPVMDLQELARGGDPAALLARKLLLLEDPAAPGRRQLLERARAALAAPPRGRYFSALNAEPPDEEACADYLKAAARKSLEALLAQREDAGS